MAIQLKMVRTTADKANVYQLRHRVFIEEEQRFDIFTDHIFDRFDSFEETTNMLAFSDNAPVAGIRVILDGPAGFPVLQAFDFEPLRRTLTGGCASVGWFCISKPFRRNPGLVVSLIQMCFRQMRKHQARHVLAVVYPPAMAFMKRLLGAQALGPEIEDPHLKVGIIPVHVDLENLPTGSRERFVDPPEHLFEDSVDRRLYRKNEVIIARGEMGTEVFQVLRGVVRVEGNGSSVAATGNTPLLMGPGQIFGELAALDGRERTSTIMAHSEDVDVMVWDNNAIMDQLRVSPERMLSLYKLMADRMRRTLDGGTANPSTALAARLLVGASGHTNQPVDARWLAGQCGLDHQSLTNMVMPWAQDHLIESDPLHQHIWVLDRSRLSQCVQM
ncbi:MAG: cyclic nucleotide-binding domain-containing protein [Desulfatitalea sp.]